MDTKKGLRYNNNKTRWSLVNFNSFEPMLRVLMYGAHKYSLFKNKKGKVIRGIDVSIEDSKQLTLIESGADNWKKGLDKKEILESMMRHLSALMDGEELDPESGLPHMGHIQCNSMFYNYFDNKEVKPIKK